MKSIYFITGSQDLYGEETLNQVALDSKEMVAFLDEKILGATIIWQPTVRSSEEAEDLLVQATADKNCIGVITWMHTFSPAKMWIKGLQKLKKP